MNNTPATTSRGHVDLNECFLYPKLKITPQVLFSMTYEHIGPQWTLAQFCRVEIEFDQFCRSIRSSEKCSSVDTCLIFRL